MRYRFIERERVHYPVTVLCHVLAVPRSGYYAWWVRGESGRARDNRHLLERIHDALQNQGVRVGRHRVARLMQQAGLRARKSRRRFRVTTDSRHGHPIAPMKSG